MTLLTRPDIDNHADAAGRAVHGVEVRAVDEVHAQLPYREVGRVGHANHMIIRGGFNNYPEEIEATLMAHPAVADAAIIGLPYPARDEEATTFAVLCGQAGETARRALCRKRLAADCVTGDQTLTPARLPSSAQIAIV